MPSIAVSFVAAKEVFRDVLLDLVGIIFVFAEFRSILIIPGDLFDVGYVPFEPSPEAGISREAAAGALVAIL